MCFRSVRRFEPVLRRAGAVALLALAGTPSFAVDRIILEVGEIVVPGTQVGGTSITLDLTRNQPVVRARAERVEVPQPVGPLRNVRLDCTGLYVREPLVACREGQLTAEGGPTKTIAMKVSAEYNTASSSAVAQG